jgi:hypothetical protein
MGREIHWATARFEACAEFTTDEPAGAVCATCGWLLDDHRLDAARPSRAAA